MPLDRLVEAHGSFASQHCIDCKKEYDSEKMRLAVEKAEAVLCDDESCAGLVKPDVVFFGESVSFSRWQRGGFSGEPEDTVIRS